MERKGNYLVSGNIVRVFAEGDINIINGLPLGTYIVKKNPDTGEMFLKKTVDLEVSKKVYGNMPQKVDRILNTFREREYNTGIMLSGVKGSGKTFMAKSLSQELRNEGISTILVNDVFNPTQLSQFLQNIVEPVMVFFDEFEKIYDRGDDRYGREESCGGGNSEKGDQNGLLSLLDGIFTTKKLFVFTCNSSWDVSSLFFNRPGRIYYHLEFKGLPEDSIREYCEEKLNNKEWTKTVISISKILKDFTFDQLQAIVEESNRYNEIPTECLEMLNISPEVDGDRFRVEVKNLGSKKYSLPKGKEYVYTNPLDESGFGIELECQGGEDEYFRFRPEDMKYYQDNEVVFVKDDVEIKLKKVAVDDNLWRFIV